MSQNSSYRSSVNILFTWVLHKSDFRQKTCINPEWREKLHFQVSMTKGTTIPLIINVSHEYMEKYTASSFLRLYWESVASLNRHIVCIFLDRIPQMLSLWRKQSVERKIYNKFPRKTRWWRREKKETNFRATKQLHQ